MRFLTFAFVVVVCASLPVRAGVVDEKAAPEPVVKCGGYVGDDCGKDGWCDFPDDAPCGLNNALGICRISAKICRRVYMPVSGCNGKTYGNSCEAKAGGTDVLHTGKCLDAGGEK